MVYARLKAAMYITDLAPFLDEKGAILPQRGPANVIADFHAAAVAYAADGGRTDLPAPSCFKCKKAPLDLRKVCARSESCTR